jgi:hypothetical protein
MRYLLAVGIGVLTAVAAATLWFIVKFVLPLVIPHLIRRVGLSHGGVGHAHAYIRSESIWIAAMIGFVAGVAWTLWTQ